MSHFETFQVFPYTPKPLLFLETLSRKRGWSWKLDARERVLSLKQGTASVDAVQELKTEALQDIQAQFDAREAHLKRAEEALKDRESYIEQAEETLMTRGQQVQEEEARLEQLREDLQGQPVE